MSCPEKSTASLPQCSCQDMTWHWSKCNIGGTQLEEHPSEWNTLLFRTQDREIQILWWLFQLQVPKEIWQLNVAPDLNWMLDQIAKRRQNWFSWNLNSVCGLDTSAIWLLIYLDVCIWLCRRALILCKVHTVGLRGERKNKCGCVLTFGAIGWGNIEFFCMYCYCSVFPSLKLFQNK